MKVCLVVTNENPDSGGSPITSSPYVSSFAQLTVTCLVGGQSEYISNNDSRQSVDSYEQSISADNTSRLYIFIAAKCELQTGTDRWIVTTISLLHHHTCHCLVTEYTKFSIHRKEARNTHEVHLVSHIRRLKSRPSPLYKVTRK